MTTYDLGHNEVLREGQFPVAFWLDRLPNERVWWCSHEQVAHLVDALRDLGHITDPDPEPLAWYTVERHGQPPLVGWFIAWTWAGGTRTVMRRSGGPWHSDTRYLPLSALRGHTELPGWGEVAPAPEPELPEPWIAVDDKPVWSPGAIEAVKAILAYAWADRADNNRVTIEDRAPGELDDHVVAWTLIRAGEVVPPHPHARVET